MKIFAYILIYMAGILWGLELIPQLCKTIKTKHVNDLSLMFFVVCLIAYIIYIIGNLILHNYNIVIAHLPSLFCNGTMVFLIKKYKGVK